MSLFLQSLLIIVREGFEAILIISALTAYLTKIGQSQKIKVIYQGSLLAILASIVTAVLLNLIFSAAEESREILEGVTMLLSMVVLFYVSYWLISKAQVIKWQQFIESKIDSSINRGNIFTLGFTAFIAVFREGAETILFYQALYSTTGDIGGGTILTGLGLGILILIVIFFVFRYTTLRMPLKGFFTVTSTLLYYLAFTFGGKGIHALQKAGWVTESLINGFPAIKTLGIYPSWEGIILQSFLMVAALMALLYNFLYIPYTERSVLTKDVSHVRLDMTNLHSALEHIRQHAVSCQQLHTADLEAEEMDEMGGHLNEIDLKIHEVMQHLNKLEGELKDIFGELEKSLKKG
ncbi:MAG: FTR1 family protein [Thermodesulfobacteriota bacterium]